MAFDLCTTKKAEHPFLIESVRIRVWTIEELCFFLSENVYLIDSSVVNERLADWVSAELGLKELGRRMRDALGRPDRDVSYFIMPIFAQIGYLTPDRQRDVRRKLMEAQVQPGEENAKRRADYLVRCGKLAAARTEYRRILKSGASGKLRTSFLESVWNNLGCAYARDFRFREAGESFLAGFRLGRSRELLRKYISVLPLYTEPEECEKRVEETGADRVWVSEVRKMNARTAADAAERAAARVRTEDPSSGAEELFDAYRRSVS